MQMFSEMLKLNFLWMQSGESAWTKTIKLRSLANDGIQILPQLFEQRNEIHKALAYFHPSQMKASLRNLSMLFYLSPV